jgi:SAM-dependent methyltransferase
MNPAEYEAMYRLEDHLWWYTGMRRITAAALEGAPSGALTDRTGPAERRADRRILDAGCGTGGNLAWLSRFGPVWGVDLSPLATAYCRRRGQGTVARSSVTRLPFPDASFDLVTSFDVIYHLGVEDDVAALAEMRRVLRPGGTLFVRVPALERLRSVHDAAVHTRQRYTTGELRAKVDCAGLDVERASYANAFLLPLAAVARLARRRRAHGKDAEGDGTDGVARPGPHETLRARPSGAAGAGPHETPSPPSEWCDLDPPETPAHQDEASDVRPVPAPLNALFGAVLGLEAAWLARADLPIGLSAFVVARKPA